MRHQPAQDPIYTRHFTFNINQLGAHHVLEILSRELKRGYELDECGLQPISLVGERLPLRQILDSLERQTGATLTLTDHQIQMHCEAEEMRVYTVDYLAIAREMNDSSSLSSALSNASSTGTNSRQGGNKSELLLSNRQVHDLWETISSQLEQIIDQKSKGIDLSTRARTIDQATDRVSSDGDEPSPRRRAPRLSNTNLERTDVTVTRRETLSGKVISSPESGTVAVIATPSQHKRVQNWLQQVQHRVDRQIVIEAVIAEISLNNRYERGIDWNLLRQNSSAAGLLVQGLSLQDPTLVFSLSKMGSQGQTSLVLSLLEEFGQTSVISTPRVATMNQQPAVLKVIDNRVYFTTDVQTSAPTANNPAFSTFTTRIQTVPVGFLMTVTPQVSGSNAIQLRVRPTLSRIVGFVTDPNPALKQLNIVSQVPEVQTRELESILRLKNGEMALLGGLRQRESRNLNRDIPGSPDALRLLTESERQSDNDIELVVLLKASVLEDNTSHDLPNEETGLDAHAHARKQLEQGLADGLALFQAQQFNEAMHLERLLALRFPRAPEPVFNQAVAAATQKKWQLAMNLLDQTDALCNDQRCELPTLLLRALVSEQIQETVD